jgi:hypothetical protein
MGYSRKGARTAQQNGKDEREKNPPVFTRKLWTPSGTLELAVFEKKVQGERNQHKNFFVALQRSYPDPQNEGKYITTNLLNPQDLLIAADLYKIAWEFILDECNRE